MDYNLYKYHDCKRGIKLNLPKSAHNCQGHDTNLSYLEQPHSLCPRTCDFNIYAMIIDYNPLQDHLVSMF